LPAAQVMPRDSPQLRVNGRHQAAKRLLVTIAPGGDQSADVPWSLDSHAGANLTKKTPRRVYLWLTVPGIQTEVFQIMTKRPAFTSIVRLFAVAAMTLTLTHSAALADDGIPIEGILAVNFTRSTTSLGIFAVSANGIGNLSNVGNLSFQLQKTLDFTATLPTMVGTFTITAASGDTCTGTYGGVITVPDSNGFAAFSGQITVTSGTGRFQGASGSVSFHACSNNGVAAYSFKGVLSTQ